MTVFHLKTFCVRKVGQPAFILRRYVTYTVGIRTFIKQRGNELNILKNKIKVKIKSYLDLVSESSMWLIRTDFSFEYPRPMMPNMEFIGGFHCKEAKTIGNDRVRRFVEEATDGLVIFSMGSMVSEMSDEKANMVAETFAKLAPLRVLWRYNEKRRPKTLGSNTLIQGKSGHFRFTSGLTHLFRLDTTK